MDTVTQITASAQDVHDALGPGHTEATYHSALEREFSSRGVTFSSEGTVPIFYKGSPVGQRRPDMFVESDDGTFIIELKAGSDKGEEQLLSYENILTDDANFDIDGALLIQFNEDLEITQSKDL